MTETIRYGLIGRQDLRLGTGTFEVTLADGRKVVLDEINISDLVTPLTKSIDGDDFGLYDIGYLSIGTSALGTNAPLEVGDEDTRTNTNKVVAIFFATTTGTPAASIGASLKLQAESADEAPSDLVELRGVFTDVSAGSEDSDFRVLLREAGAALAERFRVDGRGLVAVSDNATFTPDASAVLTVTSTTRGFLPPRLTTAQRDAVAAPAAGLIVYNSSTARLNYFDGSAWQPLLISAAATTTGTYRALGVDCRNNATTPNTQYDLDADVVQLRNSSNEIVIRHNPGAAITCDINTAGPAVNGRDQAAAFAASSWIHFYWIWNGTTLGTLASTTAPPTGPTLPTGYTHWAYAGAVRLNASSVLVATRIKGAWAYYEAGINKVNTATPGIAENTVDVSAEIPPNALAMALVGNNRAGASGDTFIFRYVTATNYLVFENTSGSGGAIGGAAILPNVSQQFFYIVTTNNTTKIYVTGYKVPNGGE